MNTFQDIIAFISSIKWTGTKDSNLIGLLGDKKIILSHSFELSNSSFDIEKYPIQIVLHIEVDGVYSTLWGLESNEDNKNFVLWYQTTKAKTVKIQFDIQQKSRKIAKDFLTSNINYFSAKRKRK